MRIPKPMPTGDFGFVDCQLASADSASAKRMREEGRRWFKSLPRQQYPTLVALADELVDAPADRRFKLGLRALLGGLQLESSKKRKRASR